MEQIGTILEFIGYWFGVPLLLGKTGLAKLENSIERGLQVFPWLGIFYVNYILFRESYTWLVSQGIFESIALVSYTIAAPIVVMVCFSLIMGAKLVLSLNRVMFSIYLTSFQDIKDLLHEIWDQSLKPFFSRWLYRSSGVLLLVIIPIWALWAYIYGAKTGNGVLTSILGLGLLGYILFFQVFIYFLIFTLIGYGIVIWITLWLKRFLIDLADDSQVQKRALWWTIALSGIGLYIQQTAVDSNLERVGIWGQIIAFFVLIPELLKLFPEKTSRWLILIGYGIFCVGLVMQGFSSHSVLNRVGLLMDAASLAITYPAVYGSLVNKSERARSVLKWASIPLSIGFLLQLTSTFS